MEKKENAWRYNSIRSISGILKLYITFFRTNNTHLFSRFHTVNRGFTIIELVVAIAVLAIFSGAVLVALDPFTQFQKAANAERKSDLAQVQRAVEAFYQDYGRYPQTTANYTIDEDLDAITVDEVAWGSGWPPYMDIMPREADSAKNYVYYSDSSGQSYWLYASIDKADSDPEACNGGAACARLSVLGVPDTACGGVCNYGVSSPNVSP